MHLPSPLSPPLPQWKVLVVDDDPYIHRAVDHCLRDFRYRDRGLEMLHAHSADEACALVGRSPELAVILMDVVMESEDAGFKAVDRIREKIGNKLVRIIVHTGQAPRTTLRQLIERYDISEFRRKDQLFSEQLAASVYAALRAYAQLLDLQGALARFDRRLNAAEQGLDAQSVTTFTNELLDGFATSLRLRSPICVVSRAPAHGSSTPPATVVGGTGQYRDCVGLHPEQACPAAISTLLEKALEDSCDFVSSDFHLHDSTTLTGRRLLILLQQTTPLSQIERYALSLLAECIGCALEQAFMSELLKHSQKQLRFMLATAGPAERTRISPAPYEETAP